MAISTRRCTDARRRVSSLWPLLGLLLLGSAPALAQQTVNLGFAPTAIQTGGTSRLTLTLGNGNAGAAAVLTAALTDTLPPGMTVANPAAVGGTCNLDAVGAAAGSHTVSYGADSVIPSGGCTIQVNVIGTSTTRNTYSTDSIPAGALQTNLGANATAASATLTVHGTAAIPSVVGMTQTAAIAALEAAGYTLGAVTHAPGPATIPYNSVLTQVPAAGAAAPAGSAVALTVSSGPGLATNPNRPLTSVPGFVQPYQQSEAAALERVCAALASANPASLTPGQHNLLANCGAIIGTYGGGYDPGGFKQTLDAISGKQTTAEQRTGVQFSGAQFANIGTRLAQLRQGVTGASFSGLDLGLPTGGNLGQLIAALEGASGNPAHPSGTSQSGGSDASGDTGGGGGDPNSISALTRLGFFINGSLRRGSQDSTTFETPFDYKANTITAGLDYRFTDRLIIGAAAGHANGTTDFTDGSGRQDSRSNSISLYGTFYNKAFYIDLIGTFAHISYAADRTTEFSINPSAGAGALNCAGDVCSVNTTGSTGARQLAFAGNVGYSFHDAGLTWGPDISIDYTRINVNGFTETDQNQSGLAMVYGDDLGESLLAKAGGHLAYAINTPYAVVLPEVRAHYVHEFKNDQRALSVHFSADPDASAPGGPVSNFVVFTDPPDRSYYDWAAGVSAQFPFGISAFADYNAVTSSDQHVHEIAFGVRFEYQVR